MRRIKDIDDGLQFLKEEMQKAHLTGEDSTATFFAWILDEIDKKKEQNKTVMANVMRRADDGTKKFIEKLCRPPNALLLNALDMSIMADEFEEITGKEVHSIDQYEGLQIIQADVGRPIVALIDEEEYMK